MKIESEWTFDCSPRHVWPHFFSATMDRTRPFLFRLGIPKPLSCTILEGKAEVGHTRQCTTDMGTIDQEILRLDPGNELQYKMKESTIWCRALVGKLVDTFTLEPLESSQTRVRRRTEFEGAGLFRGVKTLALRVALTQAHRYASRNWRRLAVETKRTEVERFV